MPKVSQEHLERRRQQILDAGMECFTQQGFHNTSMQDIFQASGLSAGAVYRYFPSKHQLVQAIAWQALDLALERLSLVSEDNGPGRTAPWDLADIVAALGGGFAVDGALAGMRPIVMEVWAEASRDPDMAVIARDVIGRLMDRIAGVLPPGTPPEVARLLMATVQGFLVQSLVFEDVTTDLVARSARAAFTPPETPGG